jgi:hypothetical protein
MDKQNAIQDLNYIKKLISETQHILDIAWPIYIYWGIEIIATFLISALWINPAELKSGGITLSMILKILVEISLWGGFGWTAYYIYMHRQKMINPKMFLIGAIGLSLVTIKLIEITGFRLIIINTGYGETGDYFSILSNGIFFSTVFIILGLIYSREQLWLGYGLLLLTLLSLWMDINHPIFGYLGNWLFWIYISTSFLIAGIMAYGRHIAQLNENKQVIVQE